jgi:malate dehydrogenase
MKITIVGAGNVGALSAMRILESGLGDVVLLDIAESIAKGKAEDLMDAASLVSHGCTIIGTSDYQLTGESDLIVITAGFARTPGMAREELIDKNTSVARHVTDNLMRFNKNPIIIVVTNPLDIISYLVYKRSGLDPRRVIGMAGCLDRSRMNLMAARQLQRPLDGIDSMVLGTHGETMVPVASQSRVENTVLTDLADNEKLDSIIKATKSRGAEIVSLLGSGSAFFAPSAGVYRMAKAIINNTKEVLPCSCMLSGEYGIKDIYLGVPALLGKDGLEDIIELPINEDENRLLCAAADSIREQILKLKI